MTNNRFFRSLVLVVLICAVTACAGLPFEPAKTFSLTDTVTFEGIQFEIKSVQFASSFYNWVNQPSYPNATFLIVEMAVTNRGSEALPFHFQPVYTLIDSAGIKYEKSEQQTIMINMGRKGAFNPTESINPNVTVVSKLVFDVPKRPYKLRVLVPYRAQVGFGGYNRVTGHFFEFDLSQISDVSKM